MITTQYNDTTSRWLAFSGDRRIGDKDGYYSRTQAERAGATMATETESKTETKTEKAASDSWLD